ncbi:cytochrome C oxidase subunit IV family protein [Pseudoduganella chitinolytica]|uniref:Cytochrome C oxidase subunit IV family protein n=1 Tax=Pseudoduganella chitinolytica TaxID=34070 RepID=A0ABY8BD05_9BURK|nr:cytochrome C oxidase subunit IV family protein [Pseudoduganella chitinolytica]WEF33796.1 cytochrome C oxidase subunit IV family protein [Pseudoduganella chitinolytica]
MQTPSIDAATGDVAAQHTQHPLGLYFKVWGLLFLLSALSYMVDLFQLQGLLRWALILGLMMAKAALIVAVFMHLRWERLALICVVIVPPLALLVLAGMMVLESDYVFAARTLYFR